MTMPAARDGELHRALADALSAPIDRLWRRLAIGAGTIFVLLLAWGLLVPIASGAIAEGRLQVQNHRKTVQHLDGGIVRAIAVREGMRVRAGQLLVRLDDADAKLAVGVLRAQADSLRAEQAAREAELAGRGAITFPADLLARAAEPGVRMAIATQRAAFEARRAHMGGDRSAIDERLSQIEEDVGGAAAQSKARASQIELFDREIRDTQTLVDKGFATRPRLLALQRAAAALRGEQAALDFQIARSRAQGAEERVQRNQVGRTSGVTAAEALRTVQADLVQVTEKLVGARDVLARKEIRAPVAGTVVGLAVTTLGGVVRPGEPLMDIVPSAEQLVVEARLSPMHVDKVRVGQPAFVRFDAGGSRTAPTVKGIVRTLSADALTDERSGERYFLATIAIPPAAMAHVPPELDKPGLPAEVLVKTGERTMVAYLLEPITRVAFRALRE